MKFDLFNLMQARDASWTPARVFADTADQVRLAEQAGFETAWFAEHHFTNYSLCPSPLMAAAYFAGQTNRIRLGSSVVVLPLYEPTRLVQEIGMVDQLSGGRLVLGIGSGYQAYEFERFRTVLDGDVMARTMEALDVIELGLTQESFEYHGRFYDYPETPIASRALQQPMPEIWIAGMHPTLLDRMAHCGYVPMMTPSWKPTASVLPARQALADKWAAAGRDPAAMPLGLMRFLHVTDDKAEAIDAAERARYSSRVSLAFRLGHATGQGIYIDDIPSEGEPTIEEMVANYIIGPVEHCIETLLEDQAVMAHSHVLCNLQLGGVPSARVMRSLEALGGEIIPAVQRELAAKGVTDPPIEQRPAQGIAAAAE